MSIRPVTSRLNVKPTKTLKHRRYRVLCIAYHSRDYPNQPTEQSPTVLLRLKRD